MAKHMVKKEFRDDESKKESYEQLKVIQSKSVDEMNSYDDDFKYKPHEGNNPLEVRTIPDLVRFLKANEGASIDAKFFVYNKNTGKLESIRCGKKGFLEAYEAPKGRKAFRESLRAFKEDAFDSDSDLTNAQFGDNVGGPDYTPQLGGPFTKNLYYYDALKMMQAAFYASNNDPFAKRIGNIVTQFVIGRGFRADCKDKKALAQWEAFSKVNNLQEMMKQLCHEIIYNGEHMIYWLPNKETIINFARQKKDAGKGLLPRIRLQDPSTCWDYCTDPDDIRQIYFYQLIYPTQWQYYGTSEVPLSSFVYEQVPADRIMHYKINAFHNEKRGRTDLYPVLGYLKRMRDSINYSLISKLKNAAWCIDTTIDGSDEDIKSYTASQKAIGTIPNAGSEFVHTKAVERQYLDNQSKATMSDDSFEVILSAIAAGSGIPTSYFGTHIHGGATRAGAVIQVEPVQKFFEDRQNLIERILLDIADRFFKEMEIEPTDQIEFTFPEIITQDRSTKLQDLALAASEGWLSKARCAAIAAKEFGVTDFNWLEEKMDIEKEPPTESPAIPGKEDKTALSNTGLGGDERENIKDIDSGR